MGELYTRLRTLYRGDGGAFPDSDREPLLPYAVPKSPTPDELAKEYTAEHSRIY